MVKNLSFEITFEVPAKVIYSALIDPMEIMKYTRAPCKVVPEVGGQYNILEGRIVGTFQELDNVKKTLTMTWKMSDWKDESKVVISFIDRDDECTITVKQTNIPDSVNTEQLEKGWKSQIFQPMSTICGYPIDE